MVHITSRMKIVCNYPTHLKICRITLIHQNILSFFSPLNRSRTSSPVKGLFLPKFCNCVGSSFYYLVLLLVLLIAVLFLCREDVKPGPEILLPRDLTEVMVPLQVKHRREETVLVGTWIGTNVISSWARTLGLDFWSPVANFSIRVIETFHEY